MREWKSVAEWPKGTLPGSFDVSDDFHETDGAATAVLRGLRKNGLGGDGKVFPVGLYVEHLEEGEWVPFGEIRLGNGPRFVDCANRLRACEVLDELFDCWETIFDEYGKAGMKSPLALARWFNCCGRSLSTGSK